MWETGKDKNIPMTSKLLIRRFLALGTREIFLLPSNIANDLVSSIAYDYQFDAFNSFSLWKAGRITGWMEALMEHAPQTCSGVLPEERITALQSTSKNKFVRGGHGPLIGSFP